MNKDRIKLVTRHLSLREGLGRLLLLALAVSPVSAQTQTGYYTPGLTQEGAIYFLPKTDIRVAVLIEKSTYTPGDFAPYAERFLRLTNVSLEPSVSYRLPARAT